MKYIIDIDMTICFTPKKYGVVNNYHESVPFKDRIDIINALYDAGHHITYWTARGAQSGEDCEEVTRKCLEDWGCKFHELNFGKPHYDVWIDDKAMSDIDFFGWDYNE